MFRIVLILQLLSMFSCKSPNKTNPQHSNIQITDSQTTFAGFKQIIDTHCSPCHGAKNSNFPGIADFKSLNTKEKWISDSNTFLQKGEPSKSSIYTRLIHSSLGDVNRRNMPFESGNFKVTMKKKDADYIYNYIKSLGKDSILDNKKSGYSVLAKLKYLIHGGALSDTDLEVIKDDPNKALDKNDLTSLLNIWWDTPESKAIMSTFLLKVFQQDGEYTHLRNDGLLGRPIDLIHIRNLWNDNIRESFVRTIWNIIDNNRPLHEIFTTNTWALTSSLLATLSFIDNPQTKQEILSGNTDFSDFLSSNAINENDFKDWRFINIRSLTDPSRFIPYTNIAKLRALENNAKFDLKTPRTGFFNTLGFQIKWQTNIDNSFRLTTNQAIIVALNELFTQADPTPSGNLEGLEKEHTNTNTPCYGCHRLLDPMRQVFANHFSPNYRPVKDYDKKQSYFAFLGKKSQMNDFQDFAQALASHSKFSSSWVQKVCTYANSSPCDESSDEFINLTKSFEASQFNFRKMVLNVLASSLVTGQSSSLEDQVNIAKVNHFCHALSVRYQNILKSESIENDLTEVNLCKVNNTTQKKSLIIPEFNYIRGHKDPIQAQDFSLFYFAGVKSICQSISTLLAAYPSFHTPSDYNKRIENYVIHIMGLPPSHPRYESSKDSIDKIYKLSQDNGLSHTEALAHSFVFACMSPDLLGLGL